MKDLDITLPCGCIATFRSQSQFTESSWDYCSKHDPAQQDNQRLQLLREAERLRDAQPVWKNRRDRMSEE